MRYLVTGGAGFIGSHLIESLINRSDQVVVLDNLSTGSSKNLIKVADQICQGWMIGSDTQLKNELGDANTYNLQGFNVVINCSPEHMENTDWLNNITKGTLVCIQSSNMKNDGESWDIKQYTATIEDFVSKYQLETVLFCDTLQIRYENNKGYDRFMMIGKK